MWTFPQSLPEKLLDPRPIRTKPIPTIQEAPYWKGWGVSPGVLSTSEKCENCGTTLVTYDNKWWHCIYWTFDRSQWLTHTPDRCREMRRANDK